MKKINNIISSELAVRSNNVNFKQEFGVVGTASNIEIIGVETVFTTTFDIKDVVFVTVNGSTLAVNEHYTITLPRTISISSSGSAIKTNPGIDTEISVGYHLINHRVENTSVKAPPVINSFYITPTEGRAGDVQFDFDIDPKDGQDIYWSILKDGDEAPIFSGNGLATVNGVVTNTSGQQELLKDVISQAEYEERAGEEIPYTFVVIYDLDDTGTDPNEKQLASAVYTLYEIQSVIGTVDVDPSIITEAGSIPATVTYFINTVDTSAQNFTWELYSVRNSTKTILESGDESSTLTGTVVDTLDISEGDTDTVLYSLEILVNGAGTPVILDRKTLFINVPSTQRMARAGYLDAAIMNYPNPADPLQMIKIGSTNTAQDVVEYTNRVPEDIFTKEFSKDVLLTGEYISADVNTFGGSVTSVYFVVEVPNNWGGFSFNQSAGIIAENAFNVVYLDAYTTAYLYNFAPSSAYAAADYFIKPK